MKSYWRGRAMNQIDVSKLSNCKEYHNVTCISAMLEGMGGRVGWTADMTNGSGKIVDELMLQFQGFQGCVYITSEDRMEESGWTSNRLTCSRCRRRARWDIGEQAISRPFSTSGNPLGVLSRIDRLNRVSHIRCKELLRRKPSANCTVDSHFERCNVSFQVLAKFNVRKGPKNVNLLMIESLQSNVKEKLFWEGLVPVLRLVTSEMGMKGNFRFGKCAQSNASQIGPGWRSLTESKVL